MLVRFKRHQILNLHNHVPGDVAEVEDERAKRLIHEKAAVEHDGPWPLPGPAAEPDPAPESETTPGQDGSPPQKREAALRPKTRKAISPVAQSEATPAPEAGPETPADADAPIEPATGA